MMGEIKNINKFVYALLLLFFCQFSFGQEVVINKEIVANNANCQQFDVELTVTGTPEIQPQEVVLLIDNSGSMRDIVTVNGVDKKLLEVAQDAAVDFVNNIFSETNDPNNLNKVAIVSYNYSANIEIELTDSSDTESIISAINNITEGGSTNMEDALIKANEVLSPPGNQGTFDCTTSRNIILLTDGLPRWHNGLGANTSEDDECEEIIDTPCQRRAFTAATNAATIVVNGETYNQQIFTVGFTGSLDANQLEVSENTLNTIQNSGAYYTNNAADLTGIYNAILGQLLAAATAVEGESLVNDQIPTGFSIVPNSVFASKGTFLVSGQNIDWNVDKVVNETLSLKYSIVASTNECGVTHPGTSTIKYINSDCNVITETFENPEVCVPCPDATITLTKNGCKSVNYASTINQSSCVPTSETFSWKFFLNGNEIGTSNAPSGTFTYTGSDFFDGDFKAELDYQGNYESNCPALMEEAEATIAVDCFSDLSLKIAVNNALPKVGETIIYTITIKNNGPQEASDIEVANVLPSGLTYNTTGSNIPAGTNFDNGSGVWDLNNVTIPNGDSLVLNLAVTVNGAGNYTNKAQITKAINEDDIDSTPGNGI